MTRLLILATWTVLLSSSAFAQDLRVMSFNIRYGTANDGENHWDQRKEFLVETIHELPPEFFD